MSSPLLGTAHECQHCRGNATETGMKPRTTIQRGRQCNWRNLTSLSQRGDKIYTNTTLDVVHMRLEVAKAYLHERCCCCHPSNTVMKPQHVYSLEMKPWGSLSLPPQKEEFRARGTTRLVIGGEKLEAGHMPFHRRQIQRKKQGVNSSCTLSFSSEFKFASPISAFVTLIALV
jgi:hypothetical protein